MAFTTSETTPPETSVDISTPLQALISIDQNLCPETLPDASLRQVKFMFYELATLCHGQNDEEVFKTLNDYFFKTKNFKVMSSPFLLSKILEKRDGCGIALALLYMHLASGLGLKLQLIHWPLHAILKWDREGRSSFIDLELFGKILDEDDLLFIVNKHKDQVRTLNMNEALVQYLTYLSMNYRHQKNNQCLHTTLDLVLRIEPENTRFLAERALLRKEMGLIKEALCDFKRFFAFTEMRDASTEIVTAFEELKTYDSNTKSV